MTRSVAMRAVPRMPQRTRSGVGPAAAPGVDATSDHRAVRNHSGLRDADDALADEVTVAVLLFDAPLVQDPHAASDAGVLVDDGVLDDRLGADTHGRDPHAVGHLDLLQSLVRVRTQH